MRLDYVPTRRSGALNPDHPMQTAVATVPAKPRAHRVGQSLVPMQSRHTYMLLVAVVLIGAYALRMIDPTPVVRLRLLAFDTYQQLQPRKYDPQVPVRIVDVDEPSLARFGQWPWPRSVIADLTKRLTEAGAAAVAFDLLFVEPDRVSLSDLINRLPKDTTLEAIGSQP